MNRAKILVVGQVPPPYHGQAISTKRFLDGTYKNAELIHLNISFSASLDEVGKFRIKKIFKLFITLFQILISKIRNQCDILYYMPCGGQRIALYRDILILFSTRWLFNKTIYHFRSAGLSIAYKNLTWVEKKLVRVAFGVPDITIRLSDLNPDDGRFLNTKKDIIIPNGMEDHYAKYGTEVANSEFVNILYIGSIRESKGLDILMEAANSLLKKNIKFRLNLAGKFHDNSFQEKVMKYIKIHESYVKYLGEISGEEKWKVFGKTDILVFPSFYENESFGLVTIEAMQFKIPVIATDWRAIPGIVQHNKSGLIVPIKDSQALASAMEELIKKPELRKELGDYGRTEYLKKYSLDRFYSNFEALFSEL